MADENFTIEQQRAIAIAEAKAKLARQSQAPEATPPPQSVTPIPTNFGPIGLKPNNPGIPGVGPIDTLLGVGSGALDFVGNTVAGIIGGAAAAPVMFTHPDEAADIQQNVTQNLASPFKAESPVGRTIAETLQFPFLGIEKGVDFVGEKASEITGSPAAGAGTKTALGSLAFGRTRRGPSTPRMDLALEAKNRGLVTLPSDATRSARGAGEGLGGKLKTQQQASQRNTDRAQELIRDDLGMPPDVPLTRENLGKYRSEQAATYDSLRSQGDINFGTPFRRDLSNAIKDLRIIEKEFAGITGSAELFKRVGQLANKQKLNADVAVSLIQMLRENADVAFTGGANKMGKAWKDSANAIESAIEAELQRRGSFDLVNQFRQSRQNIAKSYTVENALERPNGSTVSIQKLAGSKEPLTGNLEFLARFGSEFPKVSKVVNEAVPAFSPLDLASMGPSGGLAMLPHLANADPLMTAAATLPIIGQLSRPILRANALGPLGQRRATVPPLIGRGPGIAVGGQLGLLGTEKDRDGPK